MKIVFSDIDGTFQDVGLDIPKINIEAVRALQKRGDHFVFVTGRGYDLVERMNHELELDCDVIFGNGAGIKEVGKLERYLQTLSADETAAIIQILEEKKIMYFVHTSKGVLINPLEKYDRQLTDLWQTLRSELPQGETIMTYKSDYFENVCLHVADIVSFLRDHPEYLILKVELMEADENKLLEVRERFEHEPWFVFQSFVRTLEIVHPKSTKGSAVKAYMSRFPQAESYGFGDGENDLAMLETVDTPIAVANATEQVKQLSHAIAPSCEEGGVGQFIFDKILVEKEGVL